ncbi:MAG: hypothetical protein AAGL34_12420 [Bacteroidota bacterium]
MLAKWKTYLVFLTSILITSGVRAQQIGKVSNLNDTISSVEIINSDTPMVRVISDDSQYVIVKFGKYSCCYDSGTFLRLYEGNKENWTIQTYPAEDVEWTETDFDSVKVKARQLIGIKKYYTMALVSKYKIKNSRAALSIEFVTDKTYRSKPFKIDSIPSNCCLGIIEEIPNCKVHPKIQKIWIDKHNQVLLIEYGINSTNGCDRGPFFKTVTLIKNE